MIYVPNTSYACYVVQSEEVIRAYAQMPSYNTTVSYRDYYIRSDYIYKDGTQQFSTYSTLPVCLDKSILTNDFYYRTDFSNILIIFLIMSIFGLYIPLKIFFKLFKKGGL